MYNVHVDSKKISTFFSANVLSIEHLHFDAGAKRTIMDENHDSIR